MLIWLLNKFGYVQGLHAQLDSWRKRALSLESDLAYSDKINKNLRLREALDCRLPQREPRDVDSELRATLEVLTQKNIELQKEIRETRLDLNPGEIVTIGPEMRRTLLDLMPTVYSNRGDMKSGVIGKVISEFTNAEREQALGLMTPEQLDRMWPIGETVTLRRPLE